MDSAVSAVDENSGNLSAGQTGKQWEHRIERQDFWAQFGHNYPS